MDIEEAHIMCVKHSWIEKEEKSGAITAKRERKLIVKHRYIQVTHDRHGETGHDSRV